MKEKTEEEKIEEVCSKLDRQESIEDILTDLWSRHTVSPTHIWVSGETKRWLQKKMRKKRKSKK